MKKDAKLRQLIRKIVQEEMEKQNKAPMHPEQDQLEAEHEGWGLFDEPPYHPQRSEQHPEPNHDLAEWSEQPFQPHERDYQPSSPSVSKRRRRR